MQTLFAIDRATEGEKTIPGFAEVKNESTECVIALLQGPQEHGFRPAGRLPLPDRGADSAVSAAKARKCYSRIHDPDFIADIKKNLEPT